MPRPFPDKYTHNHKLVEDGAVTFDCSTDSEIWPWLTLDPIHPILVQTVNFWAAFDSGVFLDELRADAWTALTRLEWSCGKPGVGYPAHGRYSSAKEEDRSRFHLELTDEAGDLVARYIGEGVTFRTRSFEGWRGKAKEKLRQPASSSLEYAAPSALGVKTVGECFLAPLQSGTETASTTGLVTKAAGLRPNHPYIGGSGDHVNSTHMGEISRQFGQMLLGQSFVTKGGEMAFEHYVELDSPFEVELTRHAKADCQFDLKVRQAGRDCTRIEIHYSLQD